MSIVWGVVYIAVISLLGHYIGELLPRKWFDYNRFPYAAFRWEKDGAVYDKIKIKKWKKKMPDLSRIMKYMVPKKVTRSTTAADMDLLLRETCIAEFVHIAVSVLSIGTCFISNVAFGIVVFVIYTLGNLPFVLIQRYNRPHLKRLLMKLVRREQEECTENESVDLIV